MTRSHQALYRGPSKDPGPRLSAGHDPFPSQKLSHPALGPPWRRTLTIFAVAQKSMCQSVEDKKIRRLVQVDRCWGNTTRMYTLGKLQLRKIPFYLSALRKLVDVTKTHRNALIIVEKPKNDSLLFLFVSN
ncbi:hypothetical protein TNCT_69271 [Trichonephila clavata]|uniref:Uncharacterized protein n=1 Tax=Trichonephila clavata TaxID=2740835 RepID=A0A8X6KAC7_TRICU|nr:hypothetical protein TNCT_69271 [Trichonephila clavata]